MLKYNIIVLPAKNSYAMVKWSSFYLSYTNLQLFLNNANISKHWLHRIENRMRFITNAESPNYCSHAVHILNHFCFIYKVKAFSFFISKFLAFYYIFTYNVSTESEFRTAVQLLIVSLECFHMSRSLLIFRMQFICKKLI